MTRLISNSEVGAWLKCRNSYRYFYDMGVAPVVPPKSLALGILMHSVLEQYYLGVKEKKPNPVGLAEDWLANYVTTTSDYIGGAQVAEWLANYWPYAKANDTQWEILEVEKKYQIPITADFIYAMKLDLLILDHADMKIKLVDHKSTYDFWSEDDFTLNAQFPKYIGALRFNGVHVDSVLVNQIRTRKLKQPTWETIFRRTPIKYHNTTIRQALREQIAASQEIVEYRAMSEEARKAKALRIANKFNCRGCGVRSLCTAEFNGADIEYLLASEYKRNDYDAEYNPGEEVESW